MNFIWFINQETNQMDIKYWIKEKSIKNWNLFAKELIAQVHESDKMMKIIHTSRNKSD